MLKMHESTVPTSCWNKAKLDERIFVLLSRDAAAPHAIREWAKKRIELGKNEPGDVQITEALDCADLMERERQRG